MASRVLLGRLQSASAAVPMRAARGFHATARTMADATTPLPVRKPVGAFRGGLFGFLLGSTLAGAGIYSYVLSVYPRHYVTLALWSLCVPATSGV
ncbi:hypothetical protein F4774DRAFT_411630 [Daldinia eschscholtzii]|nr:hypothetical protein F4774DRAFT_411630 [Daldinia eschscholtzii]